MCVLHIHVPMTIAHIYVCIICKCDTYYIWLYVCDLLGMTHAHVVHILVYMRPTCM